MVTRRSSPVAREVGEELRRELEAIAQGEGCELIHVEFKGNTLRLVLDRPEGEAGVSLADCEAVSRQASAVLDVFDFGRQRYLLEVSSPGLDRPLYRPEDYARFVGRLVRVTYLTSGDRSKRTVVGRLESFRQADGGELTVTDTRTEECLAIPLADVQLARLEIEI